MKDDRLVNAIIIAAIIFGVIFTSIALNGGCFWGPCPGAKAATPALTGTAAAEIHDSHPARNKPWHCKDQAANILYDAGFWGERHRQAWAITWRESKHQNLGPDSPWFSGALGLWQIQTSAHSGKSWWSYDAMMDPLEQSKIVYTHMSDKGRNWQAWGLTSDGQLDTTQYGGWSTWQHLHWILYPYQQGYALYPCKTTPPKKGSE